MKKNTKGAKAKTTKKPIVKAKTIKAKSRGFNLAISPVWTKKLATLAETDKSFRGANPARYANYLIKNVLAKGVEKTTDKT
jgi:hypothetical protein